MAKNKDIKFFKKFASVATAINTIICLALIPLSKLLIKLVFGAEMLPAYRLLQFFCIAAIFEFPSVICGYQLLVIFGHKTEANMSIYITSIFHLTILGILLLLHQLNMYNVAILVVCSTLLTFFIRMFLVHKYKILNN